MKTYKTQVVLKIFKKIKKVATHFKMIQEIAQKIEERSPNKIEEISCYNNKIMNNIIIRRINIIINISSKNVIINRKRKRMKIFKKVHIAWANNI